MDLKKYELADTAVLWLKTKTGEPQIGDDGKERAGIEFYSPSSPQGAEAAAAFRSASLKLARKASGDDIYAADEDEAERILARKWAAMTKRFVNLPECDPMDFYLNRRLMHWHVQIEPFIKSLKNF